MPRATSPVRLLSSARAIVACASAFIGIALLSFVELLRWVEFPWDGYRTDIELGARDLVFSAALAVASHGVPAIWRRRAAFAERRRARTEVVFGTPRGYRATPSSELRVVNAGAVARIGWLVRQRSAAWGVACGAAICLLGEDSWCPPFHCWGRCRLLYLWDLGFHLLVGWLVVTSHLVTSWVGARAVPERNAESAA